MVSFPPPSGLRFGSELSDIQCDSYTRNMWTFHGPLAHLNTLNESLQLSCMKARSRIRGNATRRSAALSVTRDLQHHDTNRA
jgi:hypothetical protein